MKHSEHSGKMKTKNKSHKMNSKIKTMESLPMTDMDEEMGNMKGMCKTVASKS